MSTPTATDQPAAERPLAWLRQIPGDLFHLDEKPLLGSPPPFDWEQFESLLKRTFQIEDLSIKSSTWEWRSQGDLFSGIGTNLKGFPLTLVPLPGALWCAMPEIEIAQLMGILLSKKDETSEVVDLEFLKTFYRFLIVEVVNAFEKVYSDKKFSVKLSKEEGLPSEACLSSDITISLKNKTFHCRIFLNSEFRKAWAQNYQKPFKNLLAAPIADSLDVIVHLEAGRVNLNPSEWKKIRLGDFIVLDSCLLDPDEEKGRVLFVINGIPYFRAKIKQGSLKILEHPLHYEVDTAMNKSDDKNQNDADEDFEIEDLDLSDEHPTPTSEEDFEIEEEKTPTNHDAKPAQKVETKTESTNASFAKPEASISFEDVSLPIVIEVGRLQMSIKKLLELQPGNMLDLNIHPEAGVDLVLNGKRIARGELLRIGDSLGVRIVEIS